MILAILQARMSSSRLPGKILKPLAGQPMILRQIERVRRARSIDRLIIATSNDASDDDLAALCEDYDIECFRGDLNDVLKRFHDAAQTVRPDHVMRLTGDCPLADPEVIDRLSAFYHAGNYDYATNAVEPTWPDGLDAELFRHECLEKTYHEATLPSDREHVTPWIRKQPFYKIGHLKGPHDYSALRWTVDEPADYELASIIYDRFYPQNPAFTTADILRYLDERPELKTWNTTHKRNEGYAKSLQQDERKQGGKTS
jgi:spore coat polysaccharide biosynthesis protein SpsF